jgi:dolichyl-phosphate beta-glucosyltransferase
VAFPFLSIILPAYNEEKRLPGTLQKLKDFINIQPYVSEVLVVENGSQDKTLEIARQYVDGTGWLKVIHENQRGKGLAVRRGMLEACGEYRFFADVDFSMPVAEINRFIPPLLPQMEVSIASREAPGAVRYNEPTYRHIVGRIFNTLVRTLALPGLNDTQCGFKCFSKVVAEKVFRLQTLPGMSFDVEVLFIARRLGYRIIEVPIPWYFNSDSRVRLAGDSLRMGLDLVTIRRNDRRGDYTLKST